MRRFVFAVGGSLLLLWILAGQAESKSTLMFVITGGELDEYAATVTTPIPDGPYLLIGIPSAQVQPSAAPGRLPSLFYDLYLGPYETSDGPDYRYFPEPRLLHDRTLDRWSEVLPQSAAFLDASIGEALEQKARGELEIGVPAAWFREHRYAQAGYWLRPVSQVEGGLTFGTVCGHCAGIRDPETFVMRHLVGTVSRAPLGSTGERPVYAIEYYMSSGAGGAGGLVGFYAPPLEGESGRFWAAAYFEDRAAQPYETTPGFDAAIAEALARQAADVVPDPPRTLQNGSHTTPARTLLGGLAAIVAAVLLAGTFALRPVLRRRLGAERL